MVTVLIPGATDGEGPVAKRAKSKKEKTSGN